MARVHAESLARIGVAVMGFVGSSPGPVYSDLNEMLADASVEVVHICSPNYLHYEQALAALRAGKHVICEKPLAMTTAQARELRNLAADLGLVNAVCFVSRFYPLCQEAQARVRSGEVGSARMITGTYLQDWLSRETDWNWRLDPGVGGSLRAVCDIGSHWLDLVSYVSGQRVEAVMADLTTVIPQRLRPLETVETFAQSTAETVPTAVTTEDMAGILLRFDGGARGVLALSQVSPGRKNHLSWELSGAEASLGWGSENPEQLWIGHRDGPNQIQLRSTGEYPAGHAQGYPDAFTSLFRAVYAATAASVAGSGNVAAAPNFPTFDDGLQQMLVGDAIAESARLGRWVPVQR
jgi:predicted dehydrogenase